MKYFIKGSDYNNPKINTNFGVKTRKEIRTYVYDILNKLSEKFKDKKQISILLKSLSKEVFKTKNSSNPSYEEMLSVYNSLKSKEDLKTLLSTVANSEKLMNLIFCDIKSMEEIEKERKKGGRPFDPVPKQKIS